MGRLLIDDDSLVSSLEALWMLQTPSQKTLQQVLLKVVNSQIGIFISIPFPKKCTKSLSVNNLTLWRKNYTDSDFFQFYNYKIKIKLHIY